MHYRQADLLHVPSRWVDERFDLVVEIYTVQVLPPGSHERQAALAALAAVTGHTLVVIARGRFEGGDPGAMPWPLTTHELRRFENLGLRQIAFDNFLDDEVPPVRRFRGTYVRP